MPAREDANGSPPCPASGVGRPVPASEQIHVLLPSSRPRLDLRGVVRHVTRKPHVGARIGREPVASLVTTVLQCATLLTTEDLLSLWRTCSEEN